MKLKEPHPGFEPRLPIPFPATISLTLSISQNVYICWIKLACQILPGFETSISLKRDFFYETWKYRSWEREIFNKKAFYYWTDRDFLKEIDGGDFKLSLDTTVYLVFFDFMIFNVVKLKDGRNYLTKFRKCVISIWKENTYC